MPADLNPPNNLRQVLYQLSMDFAENRIQHAKTAIKNSLESGNDETKSTAGDKHETGRAMAQLEQEKAARQLQESLFLRGQLQRIDPDRMSLSVSEGSVVFTNKANFYISIAAGKLKVENTEFIAISSASPLGQKFLGQHAGTTIEMNQVPYLIEKII
ncbi:MAG: 3-oxoacyl-ACP synthase [Bacteroidota bacterium]|nr:3-oxoacyl-ACP synthase [Bacteroidota bacterium]